MNGATLPSQLHGSRLYIQATLGSSSFTMSATRSSPNLPHAATFSGGYCNGVPGQTLLPLSLGISHFVALGRSQCQLKPLQDKNPPVKRYSPPELDDGAAESLG